jgi:CBS domain containing-hemolysin-like protein
VTALWAVVALLVVVGSVLAVSEASLTRITRVRAVSLREEGRRNAALLEKIENDLPSYLNSIYFSVMLVQNGSAILVAILAEHTFAEEGSGWWVALVSAAFTLAYFVFVEAMSKTFGVMHSDRAALMVSPVVYALGRALAVPTRALIGLANLLIPGKGLKQGPFVEDEIRSMAAIGRAEGVLEHEEARLIHSVFDFGDRLVRNVMVPRTDMVAAPVDGGVNQVLNLMLRYGYSRIPVYRAGIDEIVGVVYAKDLLRHLHAGKSNVRLESIVREPIFVPESNRAATLLKQMQARQMHIALVTDEYGSTAGLVTIEDLLEELVGEIADEYDTAEPEYESTEDGGYLVSGRFSINALGDLMGVELPTGDWDTVAGLVYDLVGAVPTQGTVVAAGTLLLTVEKMQGRRIAKVRVGRRGEGYEAT